MRILLTNDDGIDSEGLGVMAHAVHGAGHDLVVVAPGEEYSGCSASMGVVAVNGDLSFRQGRWPHLPTVPCFAVEGPPAACVISAMVGAFGEVPDFVVSGINPGFNTGRSTLHSGTIGAALTALSWGAGGLAVSIGGSRPTHYQAAAALGVQTVAGLDGRLDVALNLNVPDRPLESIRGPQWALPSTIGAVHTVLVAAHDSHLEFALVETEDGIPEGSDTDLVVQGIATLTSLDPGRARDPIDGLVDRISTGCGG